MRNIIIGLLLLLSFGATAQWQQTGSKVRYVNGLGIPTKDTAAGVAADSSQILIRPADSSLYIKYKRTWVKVGSGGTIGGSGTTNYVPKFTAGTTLGNSQIFDNGTSVGIGTIPSSWRSGANAIQFGANGFGALWEQASGSVDLAFAAYESATNTFTYKTTGDAPTLYQQVTGVHSWSNAPSGTAGNTITFNERMRISSGGDVGIGYTAPVAKLSVNGTTLINTNTDNGVDKLQVSGSMNVSAKATVQTLSVVGATSTTGNIGIFNSSPFYALSVGDGTTTRQVVINGLNSGTAGGSSIAVQTNSATTMMFGNKSNIIGGAYDGQPIFGFGGSTNSLQFYNFNTTVTSAMISSGDRFLIGTTTDNGVDKLQVNGSMNVSAKATVQNLSVTNNISVTNDINQGSGTANSNYTILANGTSSGWAGRMVGEYATGQFQFQHRNNTPTWTTCFIVNANGGVGNTTFFDNAYIGGLGYLTVNASANNGVDKLLVNGSTISTQYKLSALNTAPATASSSGTLGEIRIDANYIYICTATNTWKRVAIATW